MGEVATPRISHRDLSPHLHCNFSFSPLSFGFLFGLIFETEDGGDKFLRNIWLSTNDTFFKLMEIIFSNMQRTPEIYVTGITTEQVYSK
jgi:hypothetical protein